MARRPRPQKPTRIPTHKRRLAKDGKKIRGPVKLRSQGLPGVTAETLVNVTFAVDKQNALFGLNGRVSIKKYSYNQRKRRWTFRTKTHETVHGRAVVRDHVQHIYPAYPRKDDGRTSLSDGLLIKVSCDCERFLYWWEYALWNTHAADIIYCNGQPPVNTNPRYVISCCKHLYVLLNWLLDQNK